MSLVFSVLFVFIHSGNNADSQLTCYLEQYFTDNCLPLMTQGLVCIALAAAHLEAQQVNGEVDTVFSSLPMGSTEQSISEKSDSSDKSDSGLVVRMVSNSSDSSDEDGMQDPEEILCRILQEQPKDG
jgi:hypothetical protein